MGALLGIGAAQVWVEDTGGSGDPIVLLHPSITDSTIWDRLVPLLGGNRLVRFDQPGYGKSPTAGAATRPVDDLVGVLDALALGRVHLVGNSRGGGTALSLAVTAPERVHSLTLLCPAAPGYPWPDDAGDPEIEAEHAALSEARDLDGLTDFYLRVFAACGADDHLRFQVHAATELDLSGEDLAADNPPVWDALGGLTVPTTVVLGERDDPDVNLVLPELTARIPGAELVRLDVDHLPQYRDPATVADVVLRTIARAS
jgi:pimeloyl-ACP methyl ester carboxylesterase